jgi:hypothetical protein
MNHLVVKTAQSEVKMDKNGRPYKTVSFTERAMLNTPFGPMPKPLSQCRTTKINQYEENYLGQPDPAFNAPIFNERNPQAGGYFEGKIETRNVAEYDITDSKGDTRTVNTYTTVVLGDTTSPAWDNLVTQAFKSRGHEVVAPANIVLQTVEVEETF